ncbi:hypothetical protein AGRHK599_LOCUS2438 [Rhizobium rhizogenes]|uniref:Uncharacterized protein n=1 Tax=Rhizobium rhizogenes TaxID=359 RepID=A0AAN2DDL0_RHIRH|nr:hypothetical protein [Agrobacterium tumefaciens]AXO68301.1 hypothetical protein B0909_25345 [Rhizobium rhizogenes]NSX91801.1 hypothetical protein [Agrobacterium tumefaciens]NSZ80165.1 hypothetical protein [Agrobacterium tumefaciens]OAM64258.1 hypothetical protein A8L48_14070 [Rhizobium rhizogenes]CAD0213513.1 hypothetical protein AGRHK599_LOCUS2438 [Rhizobium rhizogenes]
MEIYSLRSSNNFLFRDNSRNARSVGSVDFGKAPKSDAGPGFEETVKRIDFTRVSPRELREIAREYYDMGKISQDTWLELSSELPTQTLNANGEVIDITEVTDDTDFDFVAYFSDRAEIARSIGTADEVEKMQDVLSFFALV